MSSTYMERQLEYARNYSKRFPNVVRAHWKVANAILQGKLLPVYEHHCADCGNQAQAYDHRDYLKPLEVEPVCHSCNSLRGPGTNRTQEARA